MPVAHFQNKRFSTLSTGFRQVSRQWLLWEEEMGRLYVSPINDAFIHCSKKFVNFTEQLYRAFTDVSVRLSRYSAVNFTYFFNSVLGRIIAGEAQVYFERLLKRM
jgi:hypothetical protein